MTLGRVRRRSASGRARAAAVLAVAGLVAAGCTGGEGAETSIRTSALGSTSTTGPGSTAATTTPATASSTATATTPSTVATTTSPPTSPPTLPPPAGVTDPDLLAGGRVLCTFAGPVVPESVLARIRAGTAAGVLLFRSNLVSQDQALANAAAVQAAAAGSPSGAPAIVAADQEGGKVWRIPGPPTRSAADMGALPEPDIHEEARATAANLLSWGITIDLAPVADVVRPGTFLEAQQRSFSGDPRRTAAAVAAFVDGLHAGGVAATLKHFPGLGAASVNTDNGAATVDVPRDVLRTVDLVPFAAGVAAGADLVMMSSAVYTAFDTVPALVSPVVVGEVLRAGVGFTGVVVSDALDTPALAPLGTVGDAAIAAARAGVDLFIAAGFETCVEMEVALAAALRDGRLPVEPAQAAYGRVVALRRRLAGAVPPGG